MKTTVLPTGAQRRSRKRSGGTCFSALATVLLLAALSTACAPTPPTMDETKRDILERMTMSFEMRCMHLSEAQKRYTLKLTTYDAQRYLLAIATDDEAPCMERVLRDCEKSSPGECLAVPEEVDGKRP